MPFLRKYGLYCLLTLSVFTYALIARYNEHIAGFPLFIFIFVYVILYTFLFSKIRSFWNLILLILGLIFIGGGTFLMLIFQGFDVSGTISGTVLPYYFLSAIQSLMLIGARIKNRQSTLLQKG
jgi:hypothetical protein